MKTIKIGVIGAGFIGEIHLQSLLEIPQVESVAVCERDPGRLQAVGEKYGLQALYTDLDEMLAAEKLDAVVIATPDELHREPAEKAAAAGAHILLEKPIATTVQDGEAIIAAAKAAGVKLQIGFTLRFSPVFRRFRQRQEAGWFGDVTMAYARRACPMSEARRLNGRCSVNEYLGIHDVDLLLWLLGPGLKEVYATRGDFKLNEELGVADYYWNFLKWENGVNAAVYVTWAMPDGTPNYVETELMLTGTESVAHYDWKGQVVRLIDDKKQTYDDVFPNMIRLQAEGFIDAIFSDREPSPNGQDGLNALRVIMAAEESAGSGRPVPITLASD